MSASPSSQPSALFDHDINAVTAAWLADTSLACVAIPAILAAEAAAVLRDAGAYQTASERLASVLEESILGDKCLLNLPMCQAAVLVLGQISETALPQAPRSEQLAAIFRHKLVTES